MAWIVRKSLTNGQSVYLVRYRTAEGKARSKQFDRKRDADAFMHKVETERSTGSLIDPHLGKTTLAAWIAVWYPTVNARRTTICRDEIVLRLHLVPPSGTCRSVRLTAHPSACG